ncbi:MAG: dihydroorotase [Sphingobacteriaceae bacterium]|jgi:dihydroorotase|nr:MAG: dihydroorotase [Pedobacter sp.]
MNKILLQSVLVVNPQSKNHKSKLDVLVVDGQILKIECGVPVEEGTKVIDGRGKFLSPGFFDLRAGFGDPGLETKEDMTTGCMAAAAGGFTGIALMPNVQMPTYSKADVSYILTKAQGNLVDVHPLGCISHRGEGNELAELFDMYQTGAIAFTDGYQPVADAGLMSRALLYAKGFDGLICSFAEDAQVAGKGKMNEGVMSTFLGLKGNPALAEELMLLRDIYLAEYHEARIHFSTISTLKSVDLIRQAKRKGLLVTCDVSAHHLVFSEDDLVEFDSNYKMQPPLRTKEDIKALLEGLQDGTIDAVVSQHTPHEVEYKQVEFEKAAYGSIGLQTAFSMALRAGLTTEQIVDKMSIGPRKILGLPPIKIEVGEIANLTLFDTEALWRFDINTNRSKSSNSPLWGQQIKGQVKWVCNHNRYIEF